MDADRHIASLNRVYILLVIVTATLVILFYQQYQRSLNSYAVRRLELTHETYKSIINLSDFNNLPSKAADFYETIYGRDVAGAYVIEHVTTWLKYIKYFTFRLRAQIIFSEVEDMFYRASHRGASKPLTNTPPADQVKDTYYIPAIATQFTFGGNCSALAICGPAISFSNLKRSLSDYYALIWRFSP